jgi:hypothetical protein
MNPDVKLFVLGPNPPSHVDGTGLYDVLVLRLCPLNVVSCDLCAPFVV